jgi:putative intracellular protease/amidase
MHKAIKTCVAATAGSIGAPAYGHEPALRISPEKAQNRMFTGCITDLKRARSKIKAVLLLALICAAATFGQQSQSTSSARPARLSAPAGAPIRVAFVVTQGAVMIDFAGPWEVFQDVMIPSPGATIHDAGVRHPFELYTVSETKEPVRASGGMRIIPDYTFDDAPQPNIVVIPAQEGDSPKMMEWIRKMAGRSDIVMSVCTGAFTLAQTGLLNGTKATTHHDSWALLHDQFPAVTVLTNRRFVQGGRNVFTSGGLGSGIDLALHVVELYFGRKVAADTAYVMEYEGTGWKNGLATVKYRDGMKDMQMGGETHPK